MKHPLWNSNLARILGTLLPHLGFLLLATLPIVGCHSKPSEQAAPETESISLFKEGRGVLLSEETRKLFELEIVEVQERPMPRRIQKTAQVFRIEPDAQADAAVLLSVDEAKQLNVGQVASVRVLGESDPEITGTLTRLDKQTQTAFGHTEGVIQFADVNQNCPMGAFVSVTFTNQDSNPVLVVPQLALLSAADGHFVYTVSGTHLTRTRVKPGATSRGWVESADGLYAGDSVAAKGVENLWLVELSALKGGTPCCPVPKKKDK
jgi:multidrug efflux pump subunit AcrA (membrane-fusion protein)